MNKKDLENKWLEKQWLETIKREEKIFKGSRLETRLEELVKNKSLPNEAFLTWKLIKSCKKNKFEQLNKLNKIVKERFAKKGTPLENFECLKPEQYKHVKRLAIDKKDSFAILETGGGKSLIFQLAGIMVEGTVIVISPLVALIKQQVEELNLMYNIPAVCIASNALKYGDVESDEENEDVESILEKETDQLKDNHDIEDEKKGWLTRRKAYQEIAEGKRKFVYVTPERFRSPHFIRLLRRLSVSLIILDEVHCLSMWGRSFRPSYIDVQPVIELMRDWADKKTGLKQIRYPIIGAFTATATNQVKKDIIELLDLNLDTAEKDEVLSIFPQKKGNFNYQFIKFSDPQKTNDKKIKDSSSEKAMLPIQEWKMKGDTLINILKSEFKLVKNHLSANPFGIIFCTKIASVEKIYQELRYGSTKLFRDNVTKYYGPMDDVDKNRNAADFINGKKHIMIATNAFGMGIDKRDIRFIIHYNCPSCLEDYIQETGRAGRDGAESRCYLLYSPKMDRKIIDPYTDGQFKGLRLLYEKMRNSEIRTFVSEHSINEGKYFTGKTHKEFEKIGDDLADKLKETGDLKRYIESQIESLEKEISDIDFKLKGSLTPPMAKKLKNRKSFCTRKIDRYTKLISCSIFINYQDINPNLFGKGKFFDINRLNNIYFFSRNGAKPKKELSFPGKPDELLDLFKILREKSTIFEKEFERNVIGIVHHYFGEIPGKYLAELVKPDTIIKAITIHKDRYIDKKEKKKLIEDKKNGNLKGIALFRHSDTFPIIEFKLASDDTFNFLKDLKKITKRIAREKLFSFKLSLIEKCFSEKHKLLSTIMENDIICGIVQLGPSRKKYLTRDEFEFESDNESVLKKLKGIAVFPQVNGIPQLKMLKAELKMDSNDVAIILKKLKIADNTRNATKRREKIIQVLVNEDRDLKSLKTNDFICTSISNPIDDDANPIGDIRKMESECQKNRLKKPSILLVNRCLIAEGIRKGFYQMGYDNCSKTISLSKKYKKDKNSQDRDYDICASYKLHYDGKPYSETDTKNKLTYFDMMIADAVYTLEMFNQEICAKNIYGALCGDFRVSLTKEKKDMILGSVKKMMKTEITLQISGNICKTGWVWYKEDLYGDFSLTRSGEITEPFLPLKPLEKKGNDSYVPATVTIQIKKVSYNPAQIENSKQIPDRSNERIINHIPIIYRLAEGMMQFYVFPLYKLNLMGKNWDLYAHILFGEVKKLVYGAKIDKIARQYFSRPDCSVERVILTHFLLRRADNIPSQKRFSMKRNILSPNIRLFKNTGYAERTLYDSESLFDRLFMDACGIFKDVYDLKEPDIDKLDKNSGELKKYMLYKYSRKRKLDNILEDYGLYYIRTEEDVQLAKDILTGAWEHQIPVIYVSMDPSGTVYMDYNKLAECIPVPVYIMAEDSLRVSKMIHEEIRKYNDEIKIHDVCIYLPGKEALPLDHCVRKIVKNQKTSYIHITVSYKTVISIIWERWGKNKYNDNGDITEYFKSSLKKNCLKYILGKMREYHILDYIDSSLIKDEILKEGKISLRSLYESEHDPESWKSADSKIRKIPEMDPMEMALIFTGLVKKYNDIKDSEDDSGVKKKLKILIFFIRKFGMHIIRSPLTLESWKENMQSIKEGRYVFSSPSTKSYSNGVLQKNYHQSVKSLWEDYWEFEIKFGNLTSCLLAKKEYIERKDHLADSLKKAREYIYMKYTTSSPVLKLPCKMFPQKAKHKDCVESANDAENLYNKLSGWHDNILKNETEICATMWENHGGPDFSMIDDPILLIDRWIQDINNTDNNVK